MTSFSRSGSDAIDSPMSSFSSVFSISPPGSVECGSSIVSTSATASPEPVGLDHSSSSAAIDEREISSKAPSSSSSLTPSFFAISSSVGARNSWLSSCTIAFSMSRARERTDRGTQSIERSSSMMAPRIRWIAYVSNLTSRSGS